MEDSNFIPYFLLVRFDKGEDLRDRLEESLPILRAALGEIGTVEPVAASFDGSAVSYLIAAKPDYQPGRILEHLQSTRAGRPAALKSYDKALIVAIECAAAARLDAVTAWLGQTGCLSDT